MFKTVWKSVLSGAIALALCMSGPALAHSGRTDANGGHRDNKNVSGLGSYHYHHGYGPHLHPGGVCPYTSGGTTTTSASASSSSKSSGSTAPKTVHASTVSISGVPAKIVIGTPVKLSAAIAPTNAEEKSVTWSSSDPRIAAISSTGELTPVGVGTVQVSAKTANGVTKTVSLTISEIPVESVTLSMDADGVHVGKTQPLHAAVLPENATNRALTWASSDEGVVTVDGKGTVTGVALGTATVTATAASGIAGTWEVSCIPTPVTSVQISYDETALTDGKLKHDQQLALRAQVLPADATYPEVTWSVSNPEIAQISADGRLTPQKGGTVSVQAVCRDGVSDEVVLEIKGPSSGAAAAGVVCVGAAGVGVWLWCRKKRQ